MRSVQIGRVLISNTKYCLGRWDKAKRVVTPAIRAGRSRLALHLRGPLLWLSCRVPLFSCMGTV
jgi:hypothetical protein